MTTIRIAAEDYLAVRRSLGFKLGTQGRILMDFVAYLERKGMDTVTTEVAVEWATSPPGPPRCGTPCAWGSPGGLPPTSSFSTPAARFLPPIYCRRTPAAPAHLFSAEDIAALMTEAGRLHPSFRAATAETVIGLLAVTGLRAGEVVRLNRNDVDFTAGALAVCATKFNKSRVLALHDTTVAALRAYAIVRDQRWPDTCSPAFFMSIRGNRLARARSMPPSPPWPEPQGWSQRPPRGAPADAARPSPWLRGHHLDRVVSRRRRCAGPAAGTVGFHGPHPAERHLLVCVRGP